MKVFLGRTRNESTIKAIGVKPEAAALTLIDGARRHLTQAVSIQVTHVETQGEAETRHFALHSKRGQISGALINWLKAYLREKGWSFQGTASAPTRGTWEGVFRK